jgi:hypothetical protein
VVPELGLKLGYQITPNIKFTVGYSFLYWSEVVRPGDQINPFVNSNFLAPRSSFPGGVPGPQAPTFVGKTTDFWAQGVSLGLEFKY